MKNVDLNRLERMFYVILGMAATIFLCVYWGKENSASIIQVLQSLLVFLGGFGLGKSSEK